MAKDSPPSPAVLLQQLGLDRPSLCLSRDMIATGCEDKNVRVYYLATSSEQPLKVFTGHLAKVFHVRWSPLREGILCSGSDDGWVRSIFWSVYNQTQFNSWNKVSSKKNLPHYFSGALLCLSVCLCSTVRIWDYTQDTCINVLSGHKAPVRGLLWNTEIPYLLISGEKTLSGAWVAWSCLWTRLPLVFVVILSVT